MNTKKLWLYHLVCRLLPPSSCNGFKCRFLRWCGAKVGKNVEISSTAKFYGPIELSIGNNCFIGHDALICGAEGSKITIEDYAKVGTQAILVTGSHEFSANGECIAGEGTRADILICKGATVDTRTIVLPGKTVNKMAHVAAGSVVTHDVPEYTRVAGIPARVIKEFEH